MKKSGNIEKANEKIL